MSFSQNDFKEIYDAINTAAPANVMTSLSFHDAESSGDTTSTTGLQFGTTYNINIPAGEKVLITCTGGGILSQVGGTPYSTYTGFYFTFSGGFLPNGFYFGDINGQTPTKIKVGRGYGYSARIAPAGAQTSIVLSQILTGEIINNTGATLTITMRKAVKRTTAGSFAAWNASSARNNNFFVKFVKI